MNAGGVDHLVLFFLFCCASGPIIVLIHELGHATVPLLRTKGLVYVRVGRSPGRWRARNGRLALEINLLPGESRAGVARAFTRLRPGERLAYVLAGPAANALSACALLPLVLVTSGTPRALAGVFVVISTVTVVTNLVPRSVSVISPTDSSRSSNCVHCVTGRKRHSTAQASTTFSRSSTERGRGGSLCTPINPQSAEHVRAERC